MATEDQVDAAIERANEAADEEIDNTSLFSQAESVVVAEEIARHCIERARMIQHEMDN